VKPACRLTSAAASHHVAHHFRAAVGGIGHATGQLIGLLRVTGVKPDGDNEIGRLNQALTGMQLALRNSVSQVREASLQIDVA
jgi:methyl-accepting chemotaxis protein